MSRHHRKRTRIAKHKYITRSIFQNITNDDDITFKKMELYYIDIIDSVANHIEIKKIIEETDSIIKMFSKKEEIFQIIDLIENNILSILGNLSHNVPIGIIQCRIDYLKGIIQTLPEGYDDYGQFSCLIYDIIDLITKEFNYNVVIQNINTFHDKLQSNIFFLDNFIELRDTLFSIIENIQNGVPLGIIQCRIEHLKEMIAKVELLNC